jgi:hypothetical protein
MGARKSLVMVKQAQLAGDGASDYFALHVLITDDLDGELSVVDKEKNSKEKMALNGFAQLLTGDKGQICDDLFTGDLF